MMRTYTEQLRRTVGRDICCSLQEQGPAKTLDLVPTLPNSIVNQVDRCAQDLYIMLVGIYLNCEIS